MADLREALAGKGPTPHGAIMLALARAARPREKEAVMHHLLRLIEAVRADDDVDLANALHQLTEAPQHSFVPVRHADAGGAGDEDCQDVEGVDATRRPVAARGIEITPASLAHMLDIKMQPILLALMRAGQSVTANQKLTADQIAFLIQHGVDAR